ncbi:MAG: hypothetical protein H7829_00115 [Magnetococcus sp. THC-1_WYH]
MVAISVLLVIFSLVFIFIPVLGGYLTLIPGTLTLFLPPRLYRVAMAISGINVINILFMSPILRTNATVGLEHHDYKWAALFLGIALFHGSVATISYFKHVGKRSPKIPTPIPTPPTLPVTAPTTPAAARTTTEPNRQPVTQKSPPASAMIGPKPALPPASPTQSKTKASKAVIKPNVSQTTQSGIPVTKQKKQP